MQEVSLDEVLVYKAPPQAQVALIQSVIKTPGSDRLHSYGVLGWTVISSNVNHSDENPNGEPRYKVGDKVIYVAIDSVITPKLEAYLFPPDSKITLNNGRIKTLKLRGAISQGMIVDMTGELFTLFPKLGMDGNRSFILQTGGDVTEALEISKYEPPASSIPKGMSGQAAKRNPLFKEYTDIRHLKWYLGAGVFQEGDPLYVTEKLHGTSARYACLPTHLPAFPSLRVIIRNFGSAKEVIVKHVKKFLGVLPLYEYCFGSRRVQLQDKSKDHKGFYSENVYRLVGEANNFKSTLKPGEALFGEIVGSGIQKGYTYGCKEGEYKFFAYDVQVNGKWLDSQEFMDWCDSRSVMRVPLLATKGFNYEELDALRSGDSLVGKQKVREGIVIKPAVERNHPAIGRVAVKFINDKYLLGDQSDFH